MATQKPAGGGSSAAGAAGAGKAPLKAGAGAPRVTGGAGSGSAALGAQAFTSGNKIAMKPQAGGGSMAHEATHVVQQGAGKLKAGPGAKPR